MLSCCIYRRFSHHFYHHPRFVSLPVLTASEAAVHPHNVARGSFAPSPGRPGEYEPVRILFSLTATATTVVHDEDEGTGGGHKIVQYCFDQPCGPLNMQLHSTMLVVFLINTKNVFVIFFISASFHNTILGLFYFFAHLTQVPAPRLVRTPGLLPRPSPKAGFHTTEVLTEYGIASTRIEHLLKTHVVIDTSRKSNL